MPGANLPKIFFDAYTGNDDTRLFRSPASAYRIFDAGLHHPDERADEKSGHYQRRQMTTSSFLAKVNNGRTYLLLLRDVASAAPSPFEMEVF
jgi:hypothetical protein